MTIAGELVNILGFKLEGQENLRKFNEGMNDAEKASKRTSDRIAGFAKAATGVALAGAAFSVAAFKDAAAFERVMTRIGITAGATDKGIEDATEAVMRLARETALPLEQVVEGLDTLVSSGQELDEAMAFLPSVLRTAQASGAATTDIANTALKASSALKIEASELQRAFDIMVAGGKAGQFELKDMAMYIPGLANSFASLGYEGQEGLETLIALLQTVREDTGDASGAAVQLQNVFGKMYSEETANKFKKFGVDITKEMKAARDAGEGAVDAFVRISKEAIKGDLSKLPLLFSDQEFRLGMQSLITSADSYEKFVAAVNGSEVDGSVLNDFNRVVNDSQSSIDRMSTAWDNFYKKVGGAVAPTITGGLNAISEGLTEQEAYNRRAKELGINDWWGLKPMSSEYKAQLAREGGYIPLDDKAAADTAENTPAAYNLLGRRAMRPGQDKSGYERAAAAPDAPMGNNIGEMGVPTLAGAQSYDGLAETDSGAQSEASGLSARMNEIASMIQNGNQNLQSMVGNAAIEPVITDARTDARTFPVTVSTNITQNIQQPSAAPGAVASATGAAVGRSSATGSAP